MSAVFRFGRWGGGVVFWVTLGSEITGEINAT